MPYSKLTLEELKQNFQLNFTEGSGLFREIPEVQPTDLLNQILNYNVPLAVAIGTEKARSELIISPILVALKQYLKNKISFFSGIEFNIDPDQELTGVCDFLISLSEEQLFIQAPIIALVEAKNDNLKSGLAQCLGEMIAAQIFNQRKNNQIDIIYGVVTTGTLWQFLSLNQKNIKLDLEEYSIKELSKILGILINFIGASEYEEKTH